MYEDVSVSGRLDVYTGREVHVLKLQYFGEGLCLLWRFRRRSVNTLPLLLLLLCKSVKEAGLGMFFFMLQCQAQVLPKVVELVDKGNVLV